jgi:hypothetical protein
LASPFSQDFGGGHFKKIEIFSQCFGVEDGTRLTERRLIPNLLGNQEHRNEPKEFHAFVRSSEIVWT